MQTSTHAQTRVWRSWRELEAERSRLAREVDELRGLIRGLLEEEPPRLPSGGHVRTPAREAAGRVVTDPWF
jgi:hypothetical protein